jgi:hypothetical protein
VPAVAAHLPPAACRPPATAAAVAAAALGHVGRVHPQEAVLPAHQSDSHHTLPPALPSALRLPLPLPLPAGLARSWVAEPLGRCT